MYHNRTMKAMNKKSIIIISPPLTSPAMPSFTGAVAAGCLLPEASNVSVYDANLDFFTNHVFTQKAVEKCFLAAIQKKENGQIPINDFRVLEKIFQGFPHQSFSSQFFKSESFFDPDRYLAARNYTDDLFLLYSAGFYPSRIRWRFMGGNAIEDGQNQVFVSFCHEKLSLILKQSRPNMVVLALDSENQVSSANIFIHYIKMVFPEIKTIVLSTQNFPDNSLPETDHAFSLQNMPAFLKWINIKHKNNSDPYPEPDFSLFPLKEYLAPELILPLQPCFFKNRSSLWELVTKFKDKFKVNGFLFENPLSSLEFCLKTKEYSDLFYGVQANMKDLDNLYSGNEKPNLYFSGTRLIQWENSGVKDPEKIKGLWNLSKQGIWNHLTLNGHISQTVKDDWLEFISRNPNITHSYLNANSSSRSKDRYCKPDKNEIDPSLQAYSGVKQLPGEPFWKCLSEPAHLLLYLNHLGKKNLFSLRADKINNSIISLGSSITFHFKKPDELPPDFMDEICAMVKAGGSVDTKYVRYNLERAYLIAYAVENGTIVGNSSLKHPRDEFIDRLNRITRLDFNHFVERGYTSVRPEYRALGVGARLLKGLTERAGQYKVFSIISEDNTATQKMAKKNKTEKIAVYYSEKVGKKLGIWMPGYMIERDWKLKL